MFELITTNAATFFRNELPRFQRSAIPAAPRHASHAADARGSIQKTHDTRLQIGWIGRMFGLDRSKIHHECQPAGSDSHDRSRVHIRRRTNTATNTHSCACGRPRDLCQAFDLGVVDKAFGTRLDRRLSAGKERREREPGPNERRHEQQGRRQYPEEQSSQGSSAVRHTVRWTDLVSLARVLGDLKPVQGPNASTASDFLLRRETV
jgi:hypothetical protein